MNTPDLTNILDHYPCVSWIVDLQTRQYSYVSKNTTDFFGYDAENYMRMGQEFQDEIRHPEDQPTTRKLMQRVWNVLMSIAPERRPNYRFSYDYRILKPDGKIIRILEQNTVLEQDANGNITQLLGVCNDITQWKKNGTQLASITSSIDKQYFMFTGDSPSPLNPQALLSKRELEIVKLISQGHSSKYIADKLFISFHTVNTHRQKMIEKTNTKNTGGLVQFAAFNGLI